ncbi:MAG: transcriptional regulator, TetR family [Frankiales bacterium]|jgi:AcrR family transcriptional regulator|nr:transcriptional regulator, TetR family [Frankiales bacterium]
MGEKTAAGTRQDILSTAMALFTAQGYDATSLRQIADRLGFTKAALYYHFPAKEHLAIELTRPWLDAISNLITLNQPDPRVPQDERRRRLIEDYVDIVVAHHAVLRFLTQDAAAQKHPDVGKRALSLVIGLQDALAGPEADDADRIRVACAIGAIHATAIMDSDALTTAQPIVVSVALAVLGVDAPAKKAAQVTA